MDTTTLRWTLLILGLLLLAGIYLWGRYQPLDRLAKKQDKSGPAERSEPVLGPVDDIIEDTAGPQAVQAEPDPADQDAPHSVPDGELVMIRIVGRQGGWIRGMDICMAADRAGLTYEHGLFHRMLESEQGPAVWYSLANVQEPGTFDLDAMDQVHTPAVLLYFTLPSPMGALDSFDAMLATAERLAELLDARLLDEEGNTLSRQGIMHLREWMRQHDREHG